MIFKDRADAADRLVQKIDSVSMTDPVVIGLPRGGVPIAIAVARKLQIPFDLLIVRKLGFPENPEFGFGAITEGGFIHVNSDILSQHLLTQSSFKAVLHQEREELERRVKKFRSGKPFIDVAGRTVLLCDDGLATGVTASAAIKYVKSQGAKEIFFCAPVCSKEGQSSLHQLGADTICLSVPEKFYGVGQWYENFEQLSDEDVLTQLKNMKSLPARPSAVISMAEKKARPFKSLEDMDKLIDRIKNSQVVMLGESSHGTHEFYYWRAVITQELIENHGFQFVAVEGDWPPSQAVNGFIHGMNHETSHQVLMNFHRWPTWMWANKEMTYLINWMRFKNKVSLSELHIGFYGLDVYSLFESIDRALEQAEKIDPVVARHLKQLYACFDAFARDERRYLQSLYKIPEGCRYQVVEALRKLLESRLAEKKENAPFLFDAIQNARIIKNADKYYRAMLALDDTSWNVRDLHMLETLEILLERHGPNGKGIVWAHNTHIGDHRATDMLEHGHVNIGGLAREKWGSEKVSLVGFGSYKGTVVASPAWSGPVEVMKTPEAMAGSYEAFFHEVAKSQKQDNFYLVFDEKDKNGPFSLRRGHRAIGVVYDPEREWGNYVPTELSKRYDAFIYFDETRALTPLSPDVDRKELPETYPTGV